MKNRVAIITGCGTGIGRDIAMLFASKKIDLVLNDLNEDDLNETVKCIENMGGNVAGVVGDISKNEVNKDLVNTAFSQFGTLDIVVANAGITLFGDFLDFPLNDFDEVFRVNVKGTFLLAQNAANKLVKEKIKGCFAFISSVTARKAYKNLTAYSMSKSSIEMLAKSLVVELSPYGIRINTVSPGATLTERTAKEKGYGKKWSAITPLGTYAQERDIAEAVYFLCSDKSKHITGQNLIVDGGWSRTSKMPNEYAE